MRQLPIGIPQVLKKQALTNDSLCVFVTTLQVVPLHGAEQTGASLQTESELFGFLFFTFFLLLLFVLHKAKTVYQHFCIIRAHKPQKSILHR